MAPSAAAGQRGSRERDAIEDEPGERVRMVFLPRHGRGHRIMPTEVNSRANLWGMKKLGVSRIISVSAVGSMKEEIPPGDFVLIDQFFDRTRHRPATFFEGGVVAPVMFAEPICGAVRSILLEAARGLEVKVHDGGTYLNMEGPQFSTLAESELYRSWGCDVIGMTNMPEAKLAREAEMCYATVAMVTDYDCWHPDHNHVTVDAIIKVLLANADNGRALVKEVAPALSGRTGACEAGCHTALDDAIITGPDARDPEMTKKLSAVAGRALQT